MRAYVGLETKQQLESIAQRLGSTPSRIMAALITDYIDQERINPTASSPFCCGWQLTTTL